MLLFCLPLRIGSKQKTLAIIGVISVLAILVVGVLSMAGAVTRVTPTAMKGGIEVYTKAEIDKSFKKLQDQVTQLAVQPKTCAIYGNVFLGKMGELSIAQRSYNISILSFEAPNAMHRSYAVNLSINGQKIISRYRYSR